MEHQDAYAEAWEGIRRGFDAGRLAHAYILVGSPRGKALQFTEAFLKLLFCKESDRPCNTCAACRQIEMHKHVDTLWIEPQSRSRQIKADEIRDVVHRVTQTSFEGGWKAGIILAADCMNTQASNILLKTLEEPPPKTLLLLVTESPQALLPTISSRCQKVVLSLQETGGNEQVPWRDPLRELLHDLPPSGGLAAARLASQLKSLFDGIKSVIANAVEEDMGQRHDALDESKLKEILAARINARLREVQGEVFRIMLDWHRDVLMLSCGVDGCLIFPVEKAVLQQQADHHTPGSALTAVRTIEDLAQRLNRNIPDLQVFDEAFRKLIR